MKTAQIAELTNGVLIGAADVEITGAAALQSAAGGDVSFIEKPENAGDSSSIRASCVFVPETFDASLPCAFIRVKNPKLAFARIAAALNPRKVRRGADSSAQISPSAEIAADAFIGAFAAVGEHSVIADGAQIFDGAKIGANVRIGENTVVFPNCVIYDDVQIGNNSVIHAGAVIGADGFGFVRDGERGYVKFPQIGTVEIGDEVEIGAGTCVDRGALGATVIGDGTKIDNLVQIAHNVRVGKRVVIASQTGISGSTVIEDDCVIGGQVGMGDHALIKSGAIIGSQAGVLPGKIVRPGVWWGTPVQPLDEYKRQNAMVKGLERLREEVKRLKNQLNEMLKNQGE